LLPIKKNVEKYLRAPEIKITKLGDDIGMFGASAFFTQKVVIFYDRRKLLPF